MKSYNIGDNVYFYISVSCENVYEGKVTEIIRPDVYLIKHDNGIYEVHGQFITGLVISDKEIISQLEARIIGDTKKLQDLTKRLVEFEKELETLRETIMRQKNRINELERNQKFPFDGYNVKKPKRRDPPFPFPSTPQWKCDVDDHETYRQKYSCKCLEH
jgi:hypothetical protein